MTNLSTALWRKSINANCDAQHFLIVRPSKVLLADLILLGAGGLLVLNYNLDKYYNLLLLLIIAYQFYQHLRSASGCQLVFNTGQSSWTYIDHKHHQYHVQSIDPVYISASFSALNLTLKNTHGVHIIVTEDCLAANRHIQLRRKIICPELKLQQSAA